jgi:hypothetical protein
MNPSSKSFLQGLTIGLGPLTACAFLYYVTPLLLADNAGALLSFGLMALYLIGSIAVFVIGIILMNRNQRISGLTALSMLFIQIAVAIYFLM